MVALGPTAATIRARTTTTCEPGQCLRFTRTWLDIEAYYYSAATAWIGAEHKHPGDRHPPEGAPVFYKGGNYGHIALSLGEGKVRTTDAPSSGQVTTQDLNWPEKNWGFTYLGWSEDLNTVTIPWLHEGDDDVVTKADMKQIADMVEAQVFGHRLENKVTGSTPTFETLTENTHRNATLAAQALDTNALAAAVAEKVSAVPAEDVKQAVKDALRELVIED